MVAAIDAFFNAFDPLVRERLECAVTPYCTRIRTGFVAAEQRSHLRDPDNDVLVIVPTRSRPADYAAFAEAFFAHSIRSDLVFALDEDDPLLGDYSGLPGAQYEVNPRLRLVGTINLVANKHLDQYAYIAFMSDRHRILTPGWDELLVQAIEDTPNGMVYPNDLLARGSLPTAILMNAGIVRRLGYMVPPVLVHHFIDYFWRDLGQAMGSLRFCEDVVIAYRSEPTRSDDATTENQRDDSVDTFAQDLVAYEHYSRARIQSDTAKLKIHSEASAEFPGAAAQPAATATDGGRQGTSLDAWEPGAEIPGLVSLAEMQLWNDATVESRDPWVMEFPAEQWAYATLLPVSCPPQWPQHCRAIVSLDVEVHQGRVGMAAVDASLGQLTTLERQSTGGAERLELRGVDPPTTRWIVLRTTSDSKLPPRITISAVLSRVAGDAAPQAVAAVSTAEGLPRAVEAVAGDGLQANGPTAPPVDSLAEAAGATSTEQGQSLRLSVAADDPASSPLSSVDPPAIQHPFDGSSASTRVDSRSSLAGRAAAGGKAVETPLAASDPPSGSLSAEPQPPTAGETSSGKGEKATFSSPSPMADSPPAGEGEAEPLASLSASAMEPVTLEPGTALTGLVAVDAMQCSNNATIVAADPWCIQFPAEQWAYGVLLPVSCPPDWPAERRAIVRIDLEVHAGTIGVSGVDESSAQHTTAEHLVPEGKGQVELLVDPQSTKWIVLRTASDTGVVPDATIAAICALIAPEADEPAEVVMPPAVQSHPAPTDASPDRGSEVRASNPRHNGADMVPKAATDSTAVNEWTLPVPPPDDRAESASGAKQPIHTRLASLLRGVELPPAIRSRRRGQSAESGIVRTLVPGRPSIELIALYPEFRDYYPDCEMETKGWMVQNVQPDWICFDVGASIGYYTILLWRLAPQGHIWAYEPTTTFEMLRENVAHHGCTNVTAVQLALGERAGDLDEAIYRIWNAPAERRVYPFSTLDQEVARLGLDRLDLIKIDVDGFDLEVLRGATDTLRRFNPWLVVELHDKTLTTRGHTVAEALTWLGGQGYRDWLVLDTENYVLRRPQGSY
jgi:FkbM family methyltransferase